MSKETLEEVFDLEVEKRVKARVAEELAKRPTDPVKQGERVLKVGRAVFIRTVTHYYTGRITLIEDDAIVLEDAAWVADTARFTQTVTNGTLNEVEPFPGPVEIGRGAIIDATAWPGELPRSQK